MISAPMKRSRASQEQLSQMVDFIYENPGFTGSKSLKYYGKIERDRIWGELAEVLNSLGGAVKTVEQWQTVWRDLKSRTSIKVRDKKSQKANNQEPLMDLEKRVIAVIGRDYIESNDGEKDFENEEEFSIEMPSTDTSETELPQKSTKRLRVEDDNDTHQKQFQEIAAKQADALKTLADSNSASAEVARKQAEALKLLAECSASNLEAAKELAEAMKSVSEGIKATADAINNFAQVINRRGNLLSLLKRRKRSEAADVHTQSNGMTDLELHGTNNIITVNEDLEDGCPQSPIVVKFEIDDS